jgi:hypothetical protein
MKRRVSIEALTIVVWQLVEHMDPEQLLAACRALERMPVADEVEPLVKLLRDEARS